VPEGVLMGRVCCYIYLPCFFALADFGHLFSVNLAGALSCAVIPLEVYSAQKFVIAIRPNRTSALVRESAAYYL